MALTGTRVYVGFGFGAIQTGLFLYEAFASGNFGRFVVAEVMPELVATIRAAGGVYRCNIAQADYVAQVAVGPVEIECPAVDADRARIIEALAVADEIGTAIPSVAYYASPEPGSLHRVLAAGLRRKVEINGPRAVIYTAENHNHAAEILAAHVMELIPAAERAAVAAHVCFVNTVIGKMSGLIGSAADVQAWQLATITPSSPRAFLVEAFNRILISQVRFPDQTPFQRGLAMFVEKPDLLPFEEAKLYGHNATHALAAYVGAVQGVAQIADLRGIPGMLPFLRAAFLEESGAALIRKYAGVDPLFTLAGYQAYADDLLTRMTNPFLHDFVERVGRDPQRKLGWDDRLIGTVRLALQQGLTPHRYAFGAAAALAGLTRELLTRPVDVAALLLPLWQGVARKPDEETAVLALLETACRQLRQWYAAGRPDLEQFWQAVPRG